MLKAVIIDDEPKAIDGLSWELSNFNDQLKIVATFNDPKEGLIYLEKNNIDCLFLDIDMPTMDGFQFLNKLKSRDFAVIITTAYNEYAIKAIKNEAIDYLLKPIDSDDLTETIKKIKKYSFNTLNSATVETVLLNFNKKLTQKKIILNTDGKLIFLEPKEILFIESDGNYCTINTIENKKIVVTKKLKEINQLLPTDLFYRVHNSFIINLKKVKEFLKNDGYIVLDKNHKIPVSRQKKADFLDKF
ncbi:LytR/AlgR family response regulator transcription factor [Polaribacter sargassicola]|uniref:LytR/AlgR family response regulator transcription factor n=1 Tax=Polaribacter sargassicola TaxID=2836891 RepID=UPI001F45CA05|nr:LytTR family DNA-binding domain-containing protein [Polaribacter sp. DS7-9]MCG1034961.1 LytTR family DNA-binding domain-containing protein [Polaribacter sp. DS7-9]